MLTVFKLIYRDLGNTIHFSFLTIEFFLTENHDTKAQHKKKKRERETGRLEKNTAVKRVESKCLEDKDGDWL